MIFCIKGVLWFLFDNVVVRACAVPLVTFSTFPFLLSSSFYVKDMDISSSVFTTCRMSHQLNEKLMGTLKISISHLLHTVPSLFGLPRKAFFLTRK